MNLKLLVLGAALIGGVAMVSAPNAMADGHGDHGGDGGWHGNRDGGGDRHGDEDGGWRGDHDRRGPSYGYYYAPPQAYYPPPVYYGPPVITFGITP